MVAAAGFVGFVGFVRTDDEWMDDVGGSAASTAIVGLEARALVLLGVC